MSTPLKHRPLYTRVRVYVVVTSGRGAHRIVTLARGNNLRVVLTDMCETILNALHYTPVTPTESGDRALLKRLAITLPRPRKQQTPQVRRAVPRLSRSCA